MLSALLLALPVALQGPGETPPAITVNAEFERMAQMDLWPGYAPIEIPLAIWDGKVTWLFRHPTPPEGFQSVPHHDTVHRFAGRHEQMRANTSIELGGVATATLMLDPDGDLTRQAAVAIHEAFHVHESLHHEDWGANEAELFTWPFENPMVLGFLEAEHAVLTPAAAEGTKEAAILAGWQAVDIRKQRYAELTEGQVAYERALELYEGLATYVEHRALGDWSLPRREFPADEIRQRPYDTGMALGRLLDFVRPTWRDELETGPTRPLDELLAEAVAPHTPEDPRVLVDTITGWFQQQAVEAVADLEKQWAAKKEQYFARDGWRVEVIVEGASLLVPAGFDPWNVTRLSASEVLHERWLKLKNRSTELEVLDHACLSVAAGEHPLFNGLRQLIVTGLEGEPEVTTKDGKTAVKLGAFSMQPALASVERRKGLLTIRLLPDEEPGD